MAKETIATGKSLQDLIEDLYQELSGNSPLRKDSCMSLIHSIAAAKPVVRTPQLDKLLGMAKRKAKDLPSRSATRQFQDQITSIERSLAEDLQTTKKRTKAAAADQSKAPPDPDGSSSTKKKKARSNTGSAASTSCLPTTVGEYLERLKTQNKDLYKNPPVLPPTAIETYEESCDSLPKRDKAGRLIFVSSSDVKEIVQKFRPNRSPEEVLRGGAFGGTYFRSIHSAVTNQRYHGASVVQETLPEAWRKGLNESLYLTSAKYNATVNKFGAKCGGSLGMWESSGWISDADPYGWFQWYCRFYQGRRTSDDVRQIQRWVGVAGAKGRFKSQLCNKILAANTNASDTSISPVIRQTMWHWGLEITEDILEEHRASKK